MFFQYWTVYNQQMTKQIVYVTGCAGFIGFHVARQCLKLGWYVRGVDNESFASDPDNIQELKTYPNFTYDQLDINDLDHLYDANYIINCAASTHVDNSIIENASFLHNNINGVHRLLTLIQHKSRRPILIHFSTDEVYGDLSTGFKTETDRLCPSNPYSATKAAADQLILAWHRTYGIPYIIVRPTNNYGERQYIEKFIPSIFKNLGLERKILLHDLGLPWRTWLHVEDTAAAIIALINAGVTNDIFNISGNIEQQNITVLKAALECRGIDPETYKSYVEYIDRPGQDIRYAIDDSKLRALGWSNKRNFLEELPLISEYYKNKFIW